MKTEASRRSGLLAAASLLLQAAASLLLLAAAGCAHSPALQWHRLPLDAAGADADAAAAAAVAVAAAPRVSGPLAAQAGVSAAAAEAGVPLLTGPARGAGMALPAPVAWELVPRVAMPAYLDRDELWVEAGQGRITLLPQQRWAEPLAEAVPRVLLHDLARLRGAAPVWSVPAPAQAGGVLRLRVQLLALQAEPAQGRLRLQARWTFDSPSQGPCVADARIDTPLADASAAAVVLAHRQALWRLAQQLALGPVCQPG